ncbi:hypothetical protein [Nitrospira sp. BLG_1]|uniref:hypothetical protein n=1 Tax=Nitrospira sp. BLG_1 TaxID=3395883 RepID=UPI0039BC5583
MQKLAAIFLGTALTSLIAGCSPSVVRDYAAVLSANTSQLNDQVEQFTKSQQEIDIARDRLINMLELSTLRTENYNERRLAEWTALEGDPAFKERKDLFGMIRAYTDAAGKRESEIKLLTGKVIEMRLAAKGQRSEKLADTVKHLAALSKDPSLKHHVTFLTGFAQNIADSLKKAQDDATKASSAATNKIDVIKEKDKNEAKSIDVSSAAP